MRPPIRSRASITTTRWPFARRSRAAARPAAPAPMTRTSARSIRARCLPLCAPVEERADSDTRLGKLRSGDLVRARSDTDHRSAARGRDHSGERRLDLDAIAIDGYADEAGGCRNGSLRPLEIAERRRDRDAREAGRAGRHAERVLDQIAGRGGAPAMAVRAAVPDLGPGARIALEEPSPVATESGDAIAPA